MGVKDKTSEEEETPTEEKTDEEKTPPKEESKAAKGSKYDGGAIPRP